MICCKIFSDISVYLFVVLINIGFFAKYDNSGFIFAISFVLALSLSLSYSFDLIFTSNCLYVKF